MQPGARQRRAEPYRVVTLELPDWVTVVAERRDGLVVLVEQLRYGTNAVSLETPGGILDPGETPIAAARRELLEETGHVARRWRSLGWVHPNPALQGNRIHLFHATDAEVHARPDPDATEGLVVRLLEPEALRRRIARGGLRHALSALALERAGFGWRR